MFRSILLATALLTSVANAQSPASSTLAGGVLFGQSGGEPETLYIADSNTLAGVDPLQIRLAANGGCFMSLLSNPKTGKSLGELFAEATNQLPKPKTERVIVQIVRVFSKSEPLCAAIYFSYVE